MSSHLFPHRMNQAAMFHHHGWQVRHEGCPIVHSGQAQTDVARHGRFFAFVNGKGSCWLRPWLEVANVNRIQKGNMDTAMAKNSWSYKTIEKIYTEASILVTYLNYDLENWEMRAFVTS